MKPSSGTLLRKPRPLRVKAKFFRGLADMSRLSILEALREGRKSVTEVARRTGLSQPNASMHLSCLWECGLVEREVGRRFTHYWIGSRDVTRILELGTKLLSSVQDRIAACSRFCED
jgi:DNA-binding transcriptional ArsR family regulator